MAVVHHRLVNQLHQIRSAERTASARLSPNVHDDVAGNQHRTVDREFDQQIATSVSVHVDTLDARAAWMRAAAIIPHRPLLRGQSYTARVVATVDGRTVEKNWTFTTPWSSEADAESSTTPRP